VDELSQVREMPAAARRALFAFLEVFPGSTLESFRMKNPVPETEEPEVSMQEAG